MRVRHNKKRNTAFLYESLITELTKAIVRGQEEKKQKVLETIKKYFNAVGNL
jgi:flagellin-specific chaperone FliS